MYAHTKWNLLFEHVPHPQAPHPLRYHYLAAVDNSTSIFIESLKKWLPQLCCIPLMCHFALPAVPCCVHRLAWVMRDVEVPKSGRHLGSYSIHTTCKHREGASTQCPHACNHRCATMQTIQTHDAFSQPEAHVGALGHPARCRATGHCQVVHQGCLQRHTNK